MAAAGCRRRTNTDTDIRHALARMRACAWLRLCVAAYVRGCVCACVRGFACAWLRGCVAARVRGWVRVCACSPLRVCAPTIRAGSGHTPLPHLRSAPFALPWSVPAGVLSSCCRHYVALKGYSRGTAHRAVQGRSRDGSEARRRGCAGGEEGAPRGLEGASAQGDCAYSTTEVRRVRRRTWSRGCATALAPVATAKRTGEEAHWQGSA